MNKCFENLGISKGQKCHSTFHSDDWKLEGAIWRENYFEQDDRWRDANIQTGKMRTRGYNQENVEEILKNW